MNFTKGSQPVVDAAFLALAILRAPNELWQKLDSVTKPRLVEALRATRVIRPGFNNWLLFSATIEALLCQLGEPWDAMRVDYAVRQHEQWYKGDGIYGDGPHFHWDYYNSFVIQPMLLAVVETVAKQVHVVGLVPSRDCDYRATRYAAIQERLITPDATFPPSGAPSRIVLARFICCPPWRCATNCPTGLHRRRCARRSRQLSAA